MGAFISRQPNGLLCRFSSVVDTITDYNMTERGYVLSKMIDAKEDAEKTLQHHLKPFEWVDEYFRPGEMSQKDYDEIVREMSSPSIKKSLEDYMKLPYTFIIKEVNDEEEHYFYGKVLELDGCQSTGDTLEELKENLHEAMEGYIQIKLEKNLPITEPMELNYVVKL